MALATLIDADGPGAINCLRPRVCSCLRAPIARVEGGQHSLAEIVKTSSERPEREHRWEASDNTLHRTHALYRSMIVHGHGQEGVPTQDYGCFRIRGIMECSVRVYAFVPFFGISYDMVNTPSWYAGGFSWLTGCFRPPPPPPLPRYLACVLRYIMCSNTVACRHSWGYANSRSLSLNFRCTR